MAINPTPQVKIIESLDTSIANPNSIAYTVTGQVEPITSAIGRVYKVSTGELIFTYYNNAQPITTAEGYLFPMVKIDALTPLDVVVWAQGKTIADWTNNTQYYIEIAVVGRSGDTSAYSVGEPFWAVKSPTGSIETIGVSGVLTETQFTTTATINLQQTTVANIAERYRFILVDITSNTIAQDTGWIYGSGSGSEQFYDFTYTFYDLNDTHQYSIQFVAYTQLGSPIEANSNVFVVSTGLVITGVIEAENRCEEGCVALSVTITGKGSTLSKTPNYVLIERAITTESPLNWVAIYEEALPAPFEPTTENPIMVTCNDYYVASGAKVKYRAIPVERQGEIETQGLGITIVDDIISQFNKVFIVDSVNRYGFIVGVAYESLSLNQQTGVHQPLGSTYPIVVRNANTKYRDGGFSITIMPTDFETNADILSRSSRYDMVAFRRDIGDFLTNGAPKIMKDWNGNIWLIEIVDNVSGSFDNNVGMGVATISGSWIELGDVYDTSTLIATGLINVGG